MKKEFRDSNDTIDFLTSLKGPTIDDLQRLEAGEEDISVGVPLLSEIDSEIDVDQGQVARPNTLYNVLTRVAMSPEGQTWFTPGRG